MLTVVIEGAVLVEVAHQLPGDLAQSLRGQSAGQLSELDLGLRPGAKIDSRRQLGHEIQDHRHMLSSDLATCLRRSGGRQLRPQRFAGDGATRPERSGLRDSAAGVGTADPQPVRQHRPPGFRAHLRRSGLGLRVCGQRVLESGLAPPMGFQPAQCRQGLRSTEGPDR